MKTNTGNAWKWVKDHKMKIICGVVAIVGGVILYKVGQNSHPLVKALNELEPVKNRVKLNPDISIGNVVDCVTYTDRNCTELLIDNVPLDAMGDLIEEIKTNIPNLPENAVMYTLLSIYPSEET